MCDTNSEIKNVNISINQNESHFLKIVDKCSYHRYQDNKKNKKKPAYGWTSEKFRQSYHKLFFFVATDMYILIFLEVIK